LIAANSVQSFWFQFGRLPGRDRVLSEDKPSNAIPLAAVVFPGGAKIKFKNERPPVAALMAPAYGVGVGNGGDVGNASSTPGHPTLGGMINPAATPTSDQTVGPTRPDLIPPTPVTSTGLAQVKSPSAFVTTTNPRMEAHEEG
jgi:hypothetical protein